MRQGRDAWLALPLLLCGCVGSLRVPAPEVREYRLDYSPPAINSTPLPVVLHVSRFRAAAAYARQPIVYRDGAYATGTYFYHRWIANPASLLADLLARDLAASGLYRAIQQGASILAADYELVGEVDEFEERLSREGCRAHLSLRILLIRTRATDNPVVMQRSYVAGEPCESRTPEAFVAAMSRAVQDVSARLQQDVYAAIASDSVTSEK
jgi:ABC-type uncharacterized transport system auxiliary subunit